MPGMNLATLLSFKSTVPPSGEMTPVMSWASWLWPLPSTPAMPTISPLAMERVTSLRPLCLAVLLKSTWLRLTTHRPVPSRFS